MAKKILIVEDDENIRELLRLYLEESSSEPRSVRKILGFDGIPPSV